MQYRKMPKTGDMLSILGFGCMRLPMQDGRIDEERAITQIRHAIDSGVNYVDTAWPYHGGMSEPLLGKALAGGYREKVKVATKLPSWLIRTPEDMDRYLSAQLEKLGTDRIDYYLVHSLNGPAWDTLEALGVTSFLDRAKADGHIVNAGFSFHGLSDDFPRIVDAYPWDFCQIQYNFLDREYQAGLRGLTYAASRNLGVIVMEPLRGGNLGGAPKEIQEIWDTAETKRSPAAWALTWVWNHPEVTVVLSGMNEEAHIDENLAAAENTRPGALSASELGLVDRVATKYQALMKVGCTGCGYCLPCPADVMIPGCFETYNRMHLFKDADGARFSYAVGMSGILAGGSPRFASQCVQCGECLAKCPQGIPIPDILREVAADMEDEGLAGRLAMIRKVFQNEGN